MTDTRYDWERFWCPREASFNLSDGGYLFDPTTEFGRKYNSSVVPFEDLVASPCLVLLGEPGIGKSSALERAHASAVGRDAQGTLWIDLRSYGDEDRLARRLTNSREIRRWMDGTARLEMFLDSVDECLLRVDTLAALLAEVFTELPVDRLHLRIACRTGDWPQTLERTLIARWGRERVGVFELVPLRRRDVATAAVANGLDAEAFLAQIAEREVEAFANRPITLDFLIHSMMRVGDLPRRRVDLYMEGCRYLAAENNKSRLDAGHRGLTGVPERLNIASRIAAATVFGNRDAIWTGPEAGRVLEEDVTFHELRTASVDGRTIHDNALDEVLGTALFSSRGPNRMGWAHRTYAEFLAARWVLDSGLDLQQILSLVTNAHDPERRLVPQLQETAAWIASMRPDVFREITELDPAALRRGDVATADPEQRRALTHELLAAYESERIVDIDWSTQPLYRKLSHPGIPSQLRRFIADPSKGFIVRRAAMNIAEACRSTDVQEDVIKVALDRSEPVGLRDVATRAAATLADAEHLPLLLPLLDTERDEDPDDQIRGHALEALWPRFLSAEELFRRLAHPRRPNLYGQYKLFIATHLPSTLHDVELPTALKWVKDHARTGSYGHADVLEELADSIVIRVVGLGARSGMVEDLADIIVQRFERHMAICSGEREKEVSKRIWSDTEFRRALVIALLDRIPDQSSVWLLWHPGRPLVDHTDLAWLLAWLTSEPVSEKAAKTGADVLQHLVDWNDPAQIGDVLQATYENESLRESLSELIDPVVLDSPRAVTMRAFHERRRALEEEQIDQAARLFPLLDPPPAERVRNALGKCEAGDLDGFWTLTLELSLESMSRHYSEEFETDLTKLPGWREADQALRDRIVVAAQRYLRERDPEPERWLGTDVWYRPAFAGYKALRLIAAESPVFLMHLRPEDWARWAPVIVAFPFVNEKREKSLQQFFLGESYRFAPAEVFHALDRCIQRDIEKHGNVFGLDRLDCWWDDRISQLILTKSAEPGIQDQAFRELLWTALSHGSAEAAIRARSFLQLPLPVEQEHRSKAVSAAALLLQHEPNEAWDQVWAAFEADEEFGHEVVASIAAATHRNGVHALSESRLAALYVWISRRYPHRDDDDDREDAAFAGPLDELGWLRDALLNTLKERGTFEAVRATQWVVEQLPEVEWLRYVVHAAQANARSNTWKPPTPTHVLQLGGTQDGRFVRNGSELLDAIVSSLRKLEVKLQGETPAVIDLWNGPNAEKLYSPKDENALSNYVKRHLEEDLKRRGVVVNREVEIRRGEGEAKGENTDIQVNAIVPNSTGGAADMVTVIIEAKGCWNRDVKTAMETQLVGRYLKDNACRHGLYLVGWYNCPQWDSADYRRRQAPKGSLEEERQRFDVEARRLSTDNLEVRAFALNLALRSP